MVHKRVAVMTVLAFVVGFSMLFVGTSAAQTAPDCSAVSYDTDTDGAFLVENVDELQCMGDANTTTSVSDDFRLANNIDASGTANWNNGRGFEPVGSTGTPFNGTLDGDGNVITGLSINRSSNYQGLFGATDGATIRDLGIEDVSITNASARYLGALAGRVRGTEVYDTYSTGEISGDYTIGGLIGRVDISFGSSDGSDLMRTHSSVDVNAPGCCAGGLVGEFNGGNITDSYAEGEVNSGYCCSGGLAGWIDNHGSFIGEVNNSYSTGNVSDKDCCVGGFAGWVDSDMVINNSYSTGNVKAFDCCIGGFLGGVWGNQNTVVKNSFSTGDVYGEDGWIGGFVGDIDDNSVIRSYATGDVTARPGANSSYEDHVGGFAGTIGDEYSTGNDNLNVTESVATGNVNASGTIDKVGGFAGIVTEKGSKAVSKSYARGDVTGNDSVGGFAGVVEEGNIDESYSVGAPTATNGSAGGFVALNDSGGPVTDSYWDEEASGTSASDGGTPLTTSQMKGSNAEANMVGFDFTNTWSTVAGGYPILQNSPDLSILREDDFIDRREMGRGELDEHPRRDRDIGRDESRRNNYQDREDRRRNSGRSR